MHAHHDYYYYYYYYCNYSTSCNAPFALQEQLAAAAAAAEDADRLTETLQLCGDWPRRDPSELRGLSKLLHNAVCCGH